MRFQVIVHPPTEVRGLQEGRCDFGLLFVHRLKFEDYKKIDVRQGNLLSRRLQAASYQITDAFDPSLVREVLRDKRNISLIKTVSNNPILKSHGLPSAVYGPGHQIHACLTPGKYKTMVGIPTPGEYCSF